MFFWGGGSREAQEGSREAVDRRSFFGCGVLRPVVFAKCQIRRKSPQAARSSSELALSSTEAGRSIADVLADFGTQLKQVMACIQQLPRPLTRAAAIREEIEAGIERGVAAGALSARRRCSRAEAIGDRSKRPMSFIIIGYLLAIRVLAVFAFSLGTTSQLQEFGTGMCTGSMVESCTGYRTRSPGALHAAAVSAAGCIHFFFSYSLGAYISSHTHRQTRICAHSTLSNSQMCISVIKTKRSPIHGLVPLHSGYGEIPPGLPANHIAPNPLDGG
jgi:hypothetical protein